MFISKTLPQVIRSRSKHLFLFFGILFSCQNAWAIPTRIDVHVVANGYGATGNYHAVFLGNGFDWIFLLYGQPNGNSTKESISFIDFHLEGQNQRRLALDVTQQPVGANTSDEFLFTNTDPWQFIQCCGPTGGSWLSVSPDQGVGPFGQNRFVGTFRLQEPAENAVYALVYLTAGPNPARAPTLGSWFGYFDPAAVPEGAPLGTFILTAVSAFGIAAFLRHKV